MPTVTKKQSIKQLIGEPKTVSKELQNFRRSARLLSSHQTRLIELYPKQWIAVLDGKVRANARTFHSLMRQIDKRQVPRIRVFVRFIDKNQRSLIL